VSFTEEGILNWIENINNSYVEMTEDDINEVVSSISKVSLVNVTSSDIEKVKTLQHKLKEAIIGQEEAVKSSYKYNQKKLCRYFQS